MGDLRKIHEPSIFNNPVIVLTGTFTTSGDADDDIFTIPKNFVPAGGWGAGDLGNGAGLIIVTMSAGTNKNILSILDRTTEDVDLADFNTGPPKNDSGAEATIQASPIAAAAGEVFTVCIWGVVDDNLT